MGLGPRHMYLEIPILVSSVDLNYCSLPATTISLSAAVQLLKGSVSRDNIRW